MWHSLRIGTVAGVASLSMTLSSAGAQNGYYPTAPNPGANSYGGYNQSVIPPGGGYGNFPAQSYPPYAENPHAGPYPGGYRANVNPYAGGYPSSPSAPYPGGYGTNVNPYAGGYPSSPSAPYPGGYGAYPNSSVNRYDGAGAQGYQSNYSPPVTPPSGNYGTYPAPLVLPYPGSSSVVVLADQLIQQADGFLQAFAPTAGIVPEGQQFLAEASAVRDAAARFRQVAASGANPANEFAAVANLYQRLEARMARVSHGKIGPNIRIALQMGNTLQQLRSSFP